MKQVLLALYLTGCHVVFPVGGQDATSVEFIQGDSIVRNGREVLVELPFQRPIAAGDVVVVAIGTFGTKLLDLADSAGNVYQDGNAPVNTEMRGTLQLRYAIAATTDDLAITVTLDPIENNAQLTMAIHAYRGLLDPLVSKGAAMSNPGPDLRPVATTTTQDDARLVFAATTHDGGVAQPGPGFTRRQQPTDNTNADVPLMTEDKLGASAGTVEASATIDEAAQTSWAIQMLVFE